MELVAPAKINLFLEVLGRRPNGYHDIRSVVMPISLHDDVLLELAREDVITVVERGPYLPAGQGDLPQNGDNLATRAALALQRETGCTLGARIRLRKNIPIGGGLGGGSADAAAALAGLNRLWGTNLSRERLREIGARIGCDVPALLHGQAVCMEGLGDRVVPIAAGGESLSASDWWLVLLNPGFSVSTKDVYSRCTPSLTSRGDAYKSMVCSVRAGDFELAARSLFNGLEDAVFRKYPLIAILAEELKAAGAAAVLLSGSGASLFGLARGERDANGIADRIRQAAQSPVWCHVARTLPDGVMVAHGPLEA